MENISAIIEALILSSETPLPLEKICAVLDPVHKNDIQEAFHSLLAEYETRHSGIFIQEVAGGYQFRTRPEMAVWIKKLKTSKPISFSPAALETLAIIAYRQPVVKAEIESVRGVDVSAPLKSLLERKLVRIVGRKDVPGKPIIYGTTKKFLEVFNLKELTDLPTMRELKEITEKQGILDLEMAQEESDRTDSEIEATPPSSVEASETVPESPEIPDQTEDTTVSEEILQDNLPPFEEKTQDDPPS